MHAEGKIEACKTRPKVEGGGEQDAKRTDAPDEGQRIEKGRYEEGGKKEESVLVLGTFRGERAEREGGWYPQTQGKDLVRPNGT